MAIFNGSDGRTFDITCPAGPPEIPEWIQFAECVDCGKRVLEMRPDSESAAKAIKAIEPRCDEHGRTFHGALLSYYQTGRDDLYRKVPPLAPHRRDPKHGGCVELPDFYAELDDQKLPPHERPARCEMCAGIIDPIARTLEHPNLHPSCMPGWVYLPESTPMDTPLPEGDERS